MSQRRREWSYVIYTAWTASRGSQGGEPQVDSSAADRVAERRAAHLGSTTANNGDAATTRGAAPSRINGEAAGGLCEQPKIQG